MSSFWNFLSGFAVFNALCDFFGSRTKPGVSTSSTRPSRKTPSKTWRATSVSKKSGRIPFASEVGIGVAAMTALRDRRDSLESEYDQTDILSDVSYGHDVLDDDLDDDFFF